MKVVDRFSSTSEVTVGRRATERTEGAGIFFQRGSQIYKKAASIKLRPPPPPFWQHQFYDPHITDTPYPLNRLKIVLKSVFLNKINTTHVSVVILWLPTFYDPPIFFPKKYEPQYIWDPPPLLKKMPAP